MKHQLKDIFTIYYSPLCNYASSILKDEHQAEDVVQTVWIQLWENGKLLTLENPEPYLLRCVKFKCIDLMRSQKNKPTVHLDTVPEVAIPASQELAEEDIVPLLNYFAAKLPPKMQKVFLLSRLEKKTYREIAEELDISVKTVENQMGAALKKLRLQLKEHGYLSLAGFGLSSFCQTSS